MSTNKAPSPDGGFDAADAKLDALLRDFFRAETPATLPVAPAEAPDDWTTFSPLEAMPPSRWKRDFAAPALLASLAVLLVVGLFMLPRPLNNTHEVVAQLPEGTDGGPPTIPAVWTPDITGFPPSPTYVESRSQTKRVKNGKVSGKLNITVTDGDALVDLKYYTTSIGPVEQRTNVEWTTVRVWEPESGEWLEATVPAVRVEVVPFTQ
jgi:hypothetical protein